MSRLCVKNLPKYANEDRLRDFFSQKGEVTDAKIMRTSDGKSRQFAFVGFRTEKEGEEALRYFNNTYMDTCKITCEVARKVGDSTIPQPWSRHSQKKETQITPPKKEITPKNKIKSNPKSDGQDSSDPKLHEFLHVMQPRAKSKIWENDMSIEQETEEKEQKKEKKEKKKKKKSEKVVEEITKLPLEREGEKEKKDEIAKSALTDVDYFKSRVKKDWSDSESESESESASKSESESEPESELDSKSKSGSESESDLELETDLDSKQKESEEKENPNDEQNPNDEKKLALDTGRLFVRNLAYTATEDELRELFGQYGDVSQVHIVVDRDTKRSKGIGYVLFASPELAVRALEELDNSIFQGRLLHIMAARPQKNDKPEADEKESREKNSLKKMREEKRKEVEASGDTRAWNSLFMRQDTVVENIARKNGITKSELLDREADDLAVRIALGETHIISETKKSLLNAGVNVSALEELASKRNETHKRSGYVILVKNLPYNCTEGDLVSMFGKFGRVERVVLPPSRALALVIFLEAAEARSAFKGLAYKRYKDAPLYLEWAPDNILSESPTSIKSAEEEEKDGFGIEKDVKKVLLDQSLVDDEDIDPDRVESRSLFVKNLNFRTTDEILKQHLSSNIKAGTIKSVKIKKHVKNGKNVSMGFGFVEFDSVETATNACKDLQGTVLDGHALILQLCHGKRESSAPKKEGKDFSSTKLIVRNVAFEATTKDLRQLFSPFGQIKSVRLPMKFGNHRGFAFVEYVTKQEAQNAMQSLSNTHLYGRHLVIERAKEGETLEELRERTAAQFVDERSGFKTLARKRKQMGLVDEGNVKFSRIVE